MQTEQGAGSLSSGKTFGSCRVPVTLNLAAYEKAGSESDHLNDLLPASSVTIVIGPEGGFSEQEIRILSEQGFIPVTLGNRILQAETAALYACSVVGELCG